MKKELYKPKITFSKKDSRWWCGAYWSKRLRSGDTASEAYWRWIESLSGPRLSWHIGAVQRYRRDKCKN